MSWRWCGLSLQEFFINASLLKLFSKPDSLLLEDKGDKACTEGDSETVSVFVYRVNYKV